MAMLINGFSDLSFQRTGAFSGNLTCGSLSVHVRLDADVRGLFPYIKASFPKARYYDRPEFIRFVFDGALVNLFPDETFAGPFFTQEEALQFLQRLIAFLNDLHARKEAIEPSYQKVRQVSAVDIYRLLPHFQQTHRQRPDPGLGPGGPAQPACRRMKKLGSGPDSPLRVRYVACSSLSKKNRYYPPIGGCFFSNGRLLSVQSTATKPDMGGNLDEMRWMRLGHQSGG